MIDAILQESYAGSVWGYLGEKNPQLYKREVFLARLYREGQRMVQNLCQV